METKAKKDKLLGIIVFVAIIFVSIVIGIYILFYLINNVFSPNYMLDYEVPIEVVQKELSNRYDNVEISGVEVKSILIQYINSDDFIMALLDSDTGKILATVGKNSISSENLIKKDNYYEIKNDKSIVKNITDHITKREKINEYIDSSRTYKTYLLNRVTDERNSEMIGLIVCD